MKLKNKNAVITGGAKGIGFATAVRFVNEGCNVALFDLDATELHDAKKKLDEFRNGKVFIYLADVTEKTKLYEIAKQTEAEMGSVDILINNAGYVKGGNFLEQSDEIWEKTIDINLRAFIYTIRAFLPGMNERNEGFIVNISSASSTLGVPGLSIYTATKWAVWGFTESMRFESMNANKNVRWASIHPSYIRTGLFAGAKLGFLGNLIVPLLKDHDVIAKAILKTIKKNKNIMLRPRTLKIGIFLRGILPDKLFQAIMILMGVPQSMNNWKGRN
ncbi:MAG: SDR family NAD(P)-dependent oxidoreductase [Melioribacteraceae bacterium]|nr:MAG: SDR family NAD(P)-dependent oxidoreductase [Melioribacteraceae bacterium]